MATFIDEPLRVTYDSLGLVRALENRFMTMSPILIAFEEVLCGLGDLVMTLSDRDLIEASSQKQVVCRLSN